jgi:oxaloacetate decarboxylase (Na+ extruding) subunit gamma
MKGCKMENIGNLLFDAATLMITGMTFVFLFLTILVFLVLLMARILPKEQPVVPSIPSKNVQAVQQGSSSVSPQIVAAISVAVNKYRSSAAK